MCEFSDNCPFTFSFVCVCVCRQVTDIGLSSFFFFLISDIDIDLSSILLGHQNACKCLIVQLFDILSDGNDFCLVFC
jgi:hypothetical protein